MIEYTVIVNSFGDKFWDLNGKLHREDGPAVEWADGTKYWYIHDKRHREDGPAIEFADGSKCWFINGRQLTEEEFLEATKPKIEEPVWVPTKENITALFEELLGELNGRTGNVL